MCGPLGLITKSSGGCSPFQRLKKQGKQAKSSHYINTFQNKHHLSTLEVRLGGLLDDCWPFQQMEALLSLGLEEIADDRKNRFPVPQ